MEYTSNPLACNRIPAKPTGKRAVSSIVRKEAMQVQCQVQTRTNGFFTLDGRNGVALTPGGCRSSSSSGLSVENEEVAIGLGLAIDSLHTSRGIDAEMVDAYLLRGACFMFELCIYADSDLSKDNKHSF